MRGFPEPSISVLKNRIFIVGPGQSWGPPAFGGFLVNEKDCFLLQKRSGKGSEMVRGGGGGEQQKLRNGSKKAQEWSGESAKSSEMVWEKPEKAQKWKPKIALKWSARSPKWLRNGLAQARKNSEMVWEEPKKLRDGLRGGGKVAPAIVLGFGSYL